MTSDILVPILLFDGVGAFFFAFIWALRRAERPLMTLAANVALFVLQLLCYAPFWPIICVVELIKYIEIKYIK